MYVYPYGMFDNLFSFLYREFPYLSLCLSIQSPPSSESHYRQSNKFSADIFQLNIRSLVSNLAASFKMWTSGTSRFKEWITVNDLITPGAFI